MTVTDHTARATRDDSTLTGAMTAGLLPAFRAALAMTRSDIQAVPAARAALRAAADVCRDALAQRWAATQAEDARRAPSSRRVHYLSMEF